MANKEMINSIFKAVADPTRRKIFHILVMAGSALSLTELSEQFEISRQGVTKHVKLLEDAGLIEITGKGRERICTANLKPLQEIKDWVAFYDGFWNESIKRLDDYLDSDS